MKTGIYIYWYPIKYNTPLSMRSKNTLFFTKALVFNLSRSLVCFKLGDLKPKKTPSK